jgi:hypothetical protein
VAEIGGGIPATPPDENAPAAAGRARRATPAAMLGLGAADFQKPTPPPGMARTQRPRRRKDARQNFASLKWARPRGVFHSFLAGRGGRHRDRAFVGATRLRVWASRFSCWRAAGWALAIMPSCPSTVPACMPAIGVPDLGARLRVGQPQRPLLIGRDHRDAGMNGHRAASLASPRRPGCRAAPCAHAGFAKTPGAPSSSGPWSRRSRSW